MRKCYQMKLWLTALLLVGCQLSDANEFLDNIAYTQYDGDSFCPNSPEEELSVPILVGGVDFFNWQYSSVMRRVEELGVELKENEITRRSVAPSDLPIFEMYEDLIENYPLADVQKVYVLLGATFDLIFCYEDGVFRSCAEKHQTLYETSSTLWTYYYQCQTWGAQFTDTALKEFPSGSITKVVISVVLRMQDININQCPSSNQPLFTATSLCEPDISECRPVNGSGFKVGEYSCICKECAECGEISGTILSDPYKNGSELLKDHCTFKVDGGKKSMVGLPQGLQIGLLAVNGVCILLSMILAVIVLAFESSQVIQSSNCFILESVLLGAILKYVMLVLYLLPLSEVSCTIMPWLAELSFTFIYGAVVLKLYKSRARHRRVTTRSVITPWLAGVCVAALYLGSWTCAAWSYSASHGISLVDDGVCLFTFWEFSRPAVEFLLLCFGLVVAIRRRDVSVLYGERGWYTAVLAVELSLIIINLILRFVLPTSLTIELIYHHLTTLLSLLLIFLPKLVHMCRRRSKQLDMSDVNSQSADAADMKELDIEDLSHEQAKAKLRELTEEVETLREKMKKSEGDRRPPVSPRSNAGNEQEMEPLNPSDTKLSANQVSF